MAKYRDTIISNCEKKFITKNLEEYRRLDGRAFDEFRELTIEFTKDWGCCYVSLGKTRVLAQVTCEVQQPKASRPSEGILYLNLELTPMGAPHFEPGRQSELSVQLNRILEKCIKDSKAIDLESLCIKVGEKVWAFRVDVNVLNHEGNLIDCASVATLSALAHFRRPDITSDGEETAIHTYAERDPIPTIIHHYPVCISYAIFSELNVIVADPTLLEEGVADTTLIVGLNSYKELCSLHLGGRAFLTPENIRKCTSKAAARVNIVIQQIKDVIEKNIENRSHNIITTFENSLQFDKDVTLELQNLNLYLDQWNEQNKKKNKSRKKKNYQKVKDDVKDLNSPKSNSTVKSLGKGSAALITSEKNKKEILTIQIDESDDDVEITSTSMKDNINEIIIDSNSEEEVTIVLNDEEK